MHIGSEMAFQKISLLNSGKPSLGYVGRETVNNACINVYQRQSLGKLDGVMFPKRGLASLEMLP